MGSATAPLAPSPTRDCVVRPFAGREAILRVSSSRRWRPVERDEHILQADVPRREPGQRPILPLEPVEQGRDGAVRLGNRQGISVVLARAASTESSPRNDSASRTGAIALQGELDDVVASEPRDQLAGDPRAMIFPWLMIATRSHSRSASSI